MLLQLSIKQVDIQRVDQSVEIDHVFNFSLKSHRQELLHSLLHLVCFYVYFWKEIILRILFKLIYIIEDEKISLHFSQIEHLLLLQLN